jgi:hypothetical protein
MTQTACTCSAYHAPLCEKRRARGLCCVEQIDRAGSKIPVPKTWASYAAAVAANPGKRVQAVGPGFFAGSPRRFAAVD